jgi:AbiTii
MHLLNEIIDILSSSEPSLENALFKAQVLAHRLGEVDMKNWVVNEIKGYGDRRNLPPYRILPVTVMANLSNGIVRYSEQVLPLRSADPRVRERLENRHLTESIAVIEQWSKNDPDLSIVIAPEFYGHLKNGIDRSFEIERAWGKCSVGAMLQVVVEVRTRLLEIALQVLDRIPQEPKTELIKQVSQEVAVSEIFRNAVFGSNTTIVVGGGTIQNVSNSVHVNDIESLLAALRKQGIAEGDLMRLQELIVEDSDSEEVKAKKLGPRVKRWMAAMLKKAVEGTWNVGLGAAGGILSDAIAGYYGISGPG